MKKALRDQQQGTNIMPERITLGSYLKRWPTDAVKPSCRFKTHRTYTDLVEKHIAPALGSVLLSKLATPQIQRFLNEKHRERVGANSAQPGEQSTAAGTGEKRTCRFRPGPTQ
jgi:hypothetical protein